MTCNAYAISDTGAQIDVMTDTLQPKVTDTVTLNEYEYIMSLKNAGVSMLAAEGYTTEEIAEIFAYEDYFDEQIAAYQSLSEHELLEMGYTAEQIFTIRNYSGSEAEIMSLAATMTLTLSAYYCRWDSADNRTEARIGYSYSWDTRPIQRYTDIIGVRWNDWTLETGVATTSYVDMCTSQPVKNVYATIVEPESANAYGRGVRFSMRDTYQGTDCWARSGEGMFLLYHNYVRKDLSAYCAYAHYSIDVVPSVTIGYGNPLVLRQHIITRYQKLHMLI